MILLLTACYATFMTKDVLCSHFIFQLYSLNEYKPPISKAKMTQITKSGIKAIKVSMQCKCMKQVMVRKQIQGKCSSLLMLKQISMHNHPAMSFEVLCVNLAKITLEREQVHNCMRVCCTISGLNALKPCIHCFRWREDSKQNVNPILIFISNIDLSVSVTNSLG